MAMPAFIKAKAGIGPHPVAASKATIMAGIKKRALAKGKNPSKADVQATYDRMHTATKAKAVAKAGKSSGGGGKKMGVAKKVYGGGGTDHKTRHSNSDGRFISN